MPEKSLSSLSATPHLWLFLGFLCRLEEESLVWGEGRGKVWKSRTLKKERVVEMGQKYKKIKDRVSVKTPAGKRPRWPMEMIKLSFKLMVILNLGLDYPDRCACDSH